MKNVLIIDFYHSTNNVGGFRWRRFAKYFSEINPIFLTSGNYEEDDNTYCVPTVFSTKVSNGFSIGWDDSLWGKFKRFARGNFFIPDPRRLWFSVGRASDLISAFGITLVITTGPPHSSHLIGLKLKKRLGVKWIADFRDPWLPYYYEKMYLTPLARRLQKFYEKEVVRMADAVIACEEGIVKEDFVVSNGYDPEDFNVAFERKGGAVHVGTLTEDIPFPFRQIQGLSHEEAIKEMLGADSLVLICPYDVIPSKVYEYLYTSKPIHFFGVPGKCSRLITKCIEDTEEIKKYDVSVLAKEVERIIYYVNGM